MWRFAEECFNSMLKFSSDGFSFLPNFSPPLRWGRMQVQRHVNEKQSLWGRQRLQSPLEPHSLSRHRYASSSSTSPPSFMNKCYACAAFETEMACSFSQQYVIPRHSKQTKVNWCGRYFLVDSEMKNQTFILPPYNTGNKRMCGHLLPIFPKTLLR